MDGKAMLTEGNLDALQQDRALVSPYLPVSGKMVIIRGFTEFRLASYQDCDALDLDLG
ncbi:hypothetical protein [Herbaspirillum sp. RV1423]|uniref:hypothetical protein n=1 Tax=Herbaspirillum sp. RV1423 TaxID=1443993 RepID=UPI0012DDBFC2|nr:hypothetical protein [Herbaspirillum sp. RV1423]